MAGSMLRMLSSSARPAAAQGTLLQGLIKGRRLVPRCVCELPTKVENRAASVFDSACPGGSAAASPASRGSAMIAAIGHVVPSLGRALGWRHVGSFCVLAEGVAGIVIEI